jgi:hypothetical protein
MPGLRIHLPLPPLSHKNPLHGTELNAGFYRTFWLFYLTITTISFKMLDVKRTGRFLGALAKLRQLSSSCFSGLSVRPSALNSWVPAEKILMKLGI